MMIVEIATVSFENGKSYLYEVDDNLTAAEIKQQIFEAFKAAYYRRGARYQDAEEVILSQEFQEELEKRGFRRITAELEFVFWGWNMIDYMWDDESNELDRELWEFVRGGDSNETDH